MSNAFILHLNFFIVRSLLNLLRWTFFVFSLSLRPITFIIFYLSMFFVHLYSSSFVGSWLSPTVLSAHIIFAVLIWLIPIFHEFIISFSQIMLATRQVFFILQKFHGNRNLIRKTIFLVPRLIPSACNICSSIHLQFSIYYFQLLVFRFLLYSGFLQLISSCNGKNS